MFKLSQIARITNSILAGPDREINHFLHDSRALQSASDTIFVALRTGRNNGHAYIPELVKKGVRSFLIAEGGADTSIYDGSGCSFIISGDPLKALQQVASWHRHQFNIPVLGITGSNGKTVVKEWLFQLLKEEYTICRSPKSYNSQVGVPLSVLSLRPEHSLAIFEAGISIPGEMESLANIISPTLGIFTSLGAAHDEGFGDRETKISEKFRLFESAGKIVVNGLRAEQVPGTFISRSLVIGEEEGSGFTAAHRQGIITVQNNGRSWSVKIPFSDMASVQNICTCLAVLVVLEKDLSLYFDRIMSLQPLALRLETRNGINNSLIINDYYNSDLDSLKIALNYLHQQNGRLKKIVVVSDIEQSGISPSELYRQLALLFVINGIDLVIGIGKGISCHRNYFSIESLFYGSTKEFIESFSDIESRLANSTILLKGARSYGFEQVSRVLQLKSHDTVFEINLNRLTDNVNYYKGLVGANVKIMGMVKAMGYGSGSAEVARTLQHLGVSSLAVAYADEGVELREARVELPVMVMSPEDEAFDDIITYNLEPEIYSFGILKRFAGKLDVMGITGPFPIHIKIDTGMHRLGFMEHEIESLGDILLTLPQVKVVSVFSHLAASDNANLDEFSRQQLSVFEYTTSVLRKKIGDFKRHICNSGGITRFPHAHFDIVRLGIGMYGLGVNAAEQERLLNVGTLKTRVSQVKTVKAGGTVGYNRNGAVSKTTVIAIIPIGYADGFSRMLGNGRHGVYVKGSYCKTIGNICMDMCMVDVSEINCTEGDEVIVFENAEQINDLAKAMGTIPYEVLTSVSGRVKRVYIQE